MQTANSTPAGAGPRPGTPQRLAELYRAHVIEKQREPRFLIALSYLIMFALVRFITHSIRSHRFTFLFHNVSSSDGMHVHHFAFGILGLLAVGYLAVAFYPEGDWLRRILAIAFGISTALVLDELALWLRFQDVYWTPEGRTSVDAAFAVGSVIAIAATGRGMFLEMAHDVHYLLRRS